MGGLLAKIIHCPPKQFIVWIYAVALLMRLAFVVVKGDPVQPDFQEHTKIAHNINAGYGYSMHWPYESMLAERQEIYKHPPTFEGSFQPPLNPYLIYSSFLIFGENRLSLYAMMIFYSIVGAFLPFLAYRIGTLISEERIARYSAIIALGFLPAAYSVISYSGSPLYIVTAMVFLYGCLLARKNASSMQGYVIAGLGGGLTSLLRSEFLVLGIIVFLITFIFRPKLSQRINYRYVALALLLHIGLASIWVVRNYNLYDHVLLSGTHSWHEIWRGNNEFASGASFADNGDLVWIHPSKYPDMVHRIDSIPYDRFFEYRIDHVFRDEAIQYMTSHPALTVWLTIKKAFYFLTFDPTHRYAGNPLYSGSMVLLSMLYLIAFFTMFRLGFMKALTSPLFVLFCFFGLYMAQISISEILPRYQIYAYSVVLPVSGLGLNRLRTLLRGKQA